MLSKYTWLIEKDLFSIEYCLIFQRVILPVPRVPEARPPCALPVRADSTWMTRMEMEPEVAQVQNINLSNLSLRNP